MDRLIPFFVILPLISAFLIPVFGRLIKGFSKVMALLVFALLLLLSLYYLFRGEHASFIYKIGGWEPVNGVPIAIYFILDPLSGFMLIIINMMAFLSTLYSVSYITRYTGENYFYTLLTIMVAGLNGIVITGDLFNLYVFLEITVIASYALVAFGTDRKSVV